jgi:hypothetical protein
MINEKNILQDLENSLNFCDSVTDILARKIKCSMELRKKL